MEPNLKELSAVCRTCMGMANELSSIFSTDPPLDAHIKYCTGIVVRTDDGLPIGICNCCQKDLHIAFNFVKKCRAANEQLLKVADKLEELPLSAISNPKIEVKDESAFYLLDASWECKDETDNSAEVINDDYVDAKVIDDHVAKIKQFNKIRKKGKQKNKEKCMQSKKLHICSTCGVAAQSQAALTIHLRTHTGERPFVCHHCGGRYAQKSTLQVHIARRHSHVKLVREKKFNCDTCGKNYTTSTNLKIHVRSHTGEAPFACTLCSARFTQVGPLLAHRRRHFGEKPHKCETCGRSFGERTHLLRHRSVHTDDRPFGCVTCGVRLKSSYALKMHIERHSNNKSHVCDKCGMAFKSGGSLKSHARNLHSEKSGFCTNCQKPVSDLAEHSLSHSGEKRYACTICDARFSGRRGLAVHLRQHSVPDFPCTVEGCSQMFRRRWQLDSHLLKHSAREHVCRFCCQTFTQAGQLTKHLNLHHAVGKIAEMCEAPTNLKD